MERTRVLERGRMKNDKAKLDRIVGTNIHNQRKARRISRDELAEMLDLTVSHLGLIERGERGATPVVLNKLSRTFDMPVDSFFTVKSEKGLEAGEKKLHDQEPGAYRLKVESLIRNLTETELEALAHNITAILLLRNARHNQ